MRLQGKVTLESKASKSLHNIAMQLRKVHLRKLKAIVAHRMDNQLCALCDMALPRDSVIGLFLAWI